jgi:hypothetical protein
MIDLATFQRSEVGRFTKTLGLDASSPLDGKNGIVLVELNHFFSHHCALPAILTSLRSLGDFKFIPYIPLVSWEENHPTLDLVMSFYQTIGIGNCIVKATPDQTHFEQAKAVVLSQFECFQGEIWNLSDFSFDSLPLGVHMVESLLQQTGHAEFIQDISTVAWAVGFISRYLWWRQYLTENAVKYVVASHLCYEFALPQLAGMRVGVLSYVWHDNYFLSGNSHLPLPLVYDGWINEMAGAWDQLEEEAKSRQRKISKSELALRSAGQRVGTLLTDPRFVQGAINERGKGFFNETGVPQIVFYCHAFSDSPCVLPKQHFSSLCSPLLSTKKVLELFRELPVKLYVKTHPAPFPQDDAALDQLLQQHPEVTRFPNHTTPSDLFHLGIDAIVTGYGSICFEAAFLGIPVLAYSDFYCAPRLDWVESFDLDNPESLTPALNRCLAKRDFLPPEKGLLDAYTIINRSVIVDLTCSSVSSLPREGPEGRYSPYAYFEWSKSFDIVRFRKLVIELTKFISSRRATFSQFL